MKSKLLFLISVILGALFTCGMIYLLDSEGVEITKFKAIVIGIFFGSVTTTLFLSFSGGNEK